jgi:hypothetical protein
VAGQGQPDPPSRFLAHQIIEYGGKYYDPSYGIGDLSQEEWEQAALAGIAAWVTYPFNHFYAIVPKDEYENSHLTTFTEVDDTGVWDVPQ